MPTDNPTSTCGACRDYWSLEGDCILTEWAKPNRAGTCRRVSGQPFRLFLDEPIMDCWTAKEISDVQS